MIVNKPAEYKVNWVRVYQDKNDPKQKVGCSTKERPTRKFIEAHEKKYMQKGDVSTVPLSLFYTMISLSWNDLECIAKWSMQKGFCYGMTTV